MSALWVQLKQRHIASEGGGPCGDVCLSLGPLLLLIVCSNTALSRFPPPTALLEGQDTISLVQQLGPTALKTLGGLGIVLLGGRLFMRR
jgi:hypothetical protein